MHYILNLSIPLWWMFLPLIIATLCAYKYYQAQAQSRKQKSKSDIAFALQKSKLDELFTQLKDFDTRISMHRAQSDKDAAEIMLLQSDAAEREALIVELNKQVTELSEKVAKNYEVVQRHAINMTIKVKEIKQLQTDLNAAIAIMNRTIRGRKQWLKYKQSLVNNRMKEIREAKSENIIHDILGVPRIFQADQSESVNNRHIQDLGGEVVRGIAEQKKAIEEEMQGDGVDMSQLEAGDKVYLRGEGFDRLVESVIKWGSWAFEVKMVGYDSPKCYYSTGRWDSDNLHSNDIVQIIKQPKFDPQVGEKVGTVDSTREFTVVEIGKNKAGYMLRCSGLMNQYKPIQDLVPIPNHKYKNGYVQSN